jgi:hypothetical protein
MFRRYAPKQDRFAQPDPYDGSYNLQNPQSLNRYAYTNGDPVNYVDPSGLNLEAHGFCYFVVQEEWMWREYRNPPGRWECRFWGGGGGFGGGGFGGGEQDLGKHYNNCVRAITNKWGAGPPLPTKEQKDAYDLDKKHTLENLGLDSNHASFEGSIAFLSALVSGLIGGSIEGLKTGKVFGPKGAIVGAVIGALVGAGFELYKEYSKLEEKKALQIRQLGERHPVAALYDAFETGRANDIAGSCNHILEEMKKQG